MGEETAPDLGVLLHGGTPAWRGQGIRFQQSVLEKRMHTSFCLVLTRPIFITSSE